MKLAIGEAIEVEFDPWSLEQAQKHLDEIKAKYKDYQSCKPDAGRYETILNGMFTIMLFAQIEKGNPGSVKRLLDQAGKLAVAMSPPEQST